jgi:hypothetical protein
MDESHQLEHQRLADLEAQWAISGDPDDALTWRVAMRVHLATLHQLENTRDPEGDHHRLHELETELGDA